MLNKMIVVIPARGGSKGVPGKNIKPLKNKPLIQYTIDAARKIFNDENILVSTDSLQIKEVVEGLGLSVPFLRPSELATDYSGTQEVLLHAIDFAESKGNRPETVVLLQPTSPFRNSNHIREALEIYHKDLDMVVSVKKTASNPYYVLMEEDEHGFISKSKKGNFVRRQDCPPVFELNGAIYIINISSLKRCSIADFIKTKKYLMDEFSSHDIDTELDWLVAEKLVLDFPEFK